MFVFCFLLASSWLQTPKNLSPHFHLLFFVATGLPGIYVVHHDNALWWSILFVISIGLILDWWFRLSLLPPLVSLIPQHSATLFPVGVLNVNLGVWWCKFESLPYTVDSGISKSWTTQQCILLAENVGETHGVKC